MLPVKYKIPLKSICVKLHVVRNCDINWSELFVSGGNETLTTNCTRM